MAQKQEHTFESFDNSSQSVSGSFSYTAWEAIDMATGEMCFMCDLEAGHCTHVIIAADRSIQTLTERGLINFDLKSSMNSVTLCASCQLRYNNHCDPRLNFYPEDINFFIAFELCDRVRRARNGFPRTVPTATQYTKRSGLYKGIVFRRKGQGTAVATEPACWHGALLAAFRRAFGIMGYPRAEGIPEDMLRLRDLWNLYFRDNDSLAQIIVIRFSTAEEDFGLGGIGSDNDEPEVPGESSADDGEKANTLPDENTTDWGSVDEAG
ncbi:hypothetical protein BDW60DRAFT_203611 [Aspergillus nidulans var. acristatus]